MRGKAIRKPDLSLIYPGVFKTPGIARKALPATPGAGIQKIKPSISVVDSADDITIRLSAPGFRREDFIVIVQNCRLSIYASHAKLAADGPAENLQEQVEYYFRRRLQLPGNVDPDFVSAEYKEGMLCLRFLKFYQVCESKRHQVAVY